MRDGELLRAGWKTSKNQLLYNAAYPLCKYSVFMICTVHVTKQHTSKKPMQMTSDSLSCAFQKVQNFTGNAIRTVHGKEMKF